MSLFRGKFGFGGAKRKPATVTQRKRVRLGLEPLESRALLSTFTVTSTAGDNSSGSLRAEVQAAQQAGSGNTVNFAPGLSGATIALSPNLGPIVINNPQLTITGASLAHPVNIDGGGQFGTLVFSVQGGTEAITGVNINNGVGAFQNGGSLTLTNVGLTGDNGPAGEGAVYNLGSLTVAGGTVSSCTNGGITNFGTAFSVTGTKFSNDTPYAVKTMEGGTLNKLTVTGSGDAQTNVGAITAEGNGTFSLTNSSLTGNAVALSEYGSAAYSVTSPRINRNQLGVGVLASQYDTATLSNLTISRNTAGALTIEDYGGTPGGPVNVTNCTISGNSGNVVVGAAEGGTVFSFCAISHNTMTGSPAALLFDSINPGDKCVVSASTVDHNTSKSTTGSDGGGIGATATPGVPGSLYVTNSTILDNTAYGYGGGVYAYGPVKVTIAASTITGNSALDYQFGKGTGGGIAQLPGSTVSLTNTIDAGNTAQTAAPDFYGKASKSTYDLIGNDSGSSGWGTPNLLGTASSPINPLFDAPAYNGGPNKNVLTLAVQPASPAINFGNGLIGFTDEANNIRTDETIGALDQVKAAAVNSAVGPIVAPNPALVDLTFLGDWDDFGTGWHHHHFHGVA